MRVKALFRHDGSLSVLSHSNLLTFLQLELRLITSSFSYILMGNHQEEEIIFFSNWKELVS